MVGKKIMINDLFIKLIGYPPIGKMTINILKSRILKPFQLPLQLVVEKQEKMLKDKFGRMKNTDIGKKLQISQVGKLKEIPITDYDFYNPYFSNPTPRAFMYPLDNYERVKTSGTAGEEKWFMLTRNFIVNSAFKTGLSITLLTTHNGNNIALNYGDMIYINTAPRPFATGVMTSLVSGQRDRFPLFNIVPNINLSFEEKVTFFINNYESIDSANMQASILISRIIPEIKKKTTKPKFKLKGLYCPDTVIADEYFDEIKEFFGVPPRTCYNSTETLSCSIPSVEHSLGFILDWRQGLFEFIPVKEGIIEESEAIGIDKVEIGKVYQVLYTGFENELTRYNTFNAFKCIAKCDNLLGIDSPIFKFHARLEKNVALNDFTRISENELITAFKELGIPFVEFTSIKEIEKGLEYLTIFLETTADIGEKKIQEMLHKKLYEMDRDYRDLSVFFSYVPIRVSLVPLGSFAKYLEKKIATVAKVDRILMQDGNFKNFLASIR